MSITSTSNADCVIIGNSISSCLLSILLSKKNYTVLLFNNNNLNNPDSEEKYSIVPLNFLKLHSIPYSELSIKNKASDGYIERFTTYEKFFLQKNLENKYEFNMFYTFRQFGIVNHRLFHKFLTTLMKREKKLKEELIDDSFVINKKETKANNSVYQIQTSNQELELPGNRIIITDEIFRDRLKQNFVTIKVPMFKYQFRIGELLSDSINHYLMTNDNVIKKITIIPCSKFSIIEFYTIEELMDPYHEDFTQFLLEKYEILSTNLEFQFKELYFLPTAMENVDNLNIIPAKILFSFPIQSKLFNEIQSAFYLSLAMDNETDFPYYEWLNQTLNKLNLLNMVFLKDNNLNLETLIAELIKNKNISHINKLSKFFLSIRFKSYFKSKNFTFKEFETILKILSYSEII